MDALEFLEAVWPEQGIYCLVTQPGWQHRTFNSIADAARAAENLRDKKDVYFAVHTLKQHSVPDLSKGEDGRAWRTHANMAECRCFFFDLDVGEGAGKYATRQEALDGLDQFLFRTRLPSPLVTSSGGGFHIYWRLDESLPSGDWYTQAARLREVARRQGLLADPARTTDVSSILRVAGTINHKEGGARPVSAINGGQPVALRAFLDQLEGLTEGFDAPTFSEPRARGAELTEGNLSRPIWNGPIFSLDDICGVCEHVRDYRDASERGDHIDEPIWYAHLGLVQHLDGGDRWVRELGKRTRTVEEKYAKLTQWNTRTGGQPPSCAKLNDVCGGDACQRCPFAGLGKNPLTIAAEVRKRAPIEPEVIEVGEAGDDFDLRGGHNAGGSQGLIPIAEPEFPYSRAKGGIYRQNEDKDGKTKSDLICEYDIFVYDVCERTEREEAFSMWAITLPLVGQKTLKIPTAALQDLKQLHHLLLNNGILVSSKKVPMIQEFALSSLAEAQKVRAANRQFDHLGWNDKSLTEFITPTTLYLTDGSEKPCTLSSQAKSATNYVCSEGTLERQVELMEFYNTDTYLPHQFMTLCGLASPMFQASGEHGIVVNACGESGASKTTSLYTAASMWGYPKDYVINGTETGATAIARLSTIFTLSNLPVCVDEITEMDPAHIKTFVLGGTQKGDRVRSLRNGEIQQPRGGYKSTFILTSSNTSINNSLSQENRAGVAGHMRVFEMLCKPTGGDFTPGVEFLHALNKNYGHIGPAFLRHYLPRRQAYDDAVVKLGNVIAQKCGMAASERFWGLSIATAMITGAIAAEHGLLPFDLTRLREWLLDEQLPHMRGEVRSETAAGNPAALLAAFLNDKVGNTIIVQPGAGGAEEWSQSDPRGPVVAHRDIRRQIVHVRKDTFRHWCNDRNRSGLHVIRSLQQSKIISEDQKQTLGKGTRFASVRAICFTVDLTHPEIAAENVAPKVQTLKPLLEAAREVEE